MHSCLENVHEMQAAGYVQVMYSKCHMSLILEMCKTHDISDTAGNLQEISCVFAWNHMWNVKFPMLLETCRKCYVYLSWKCT